MDTSHPLVFWATIVMVQYLNHIHWSGCYKWIDIAGNGGVDTTGNKVDIDENEVDTAGNEVGNARVDTTWNEKGTTGNRGDMLKMK